MSQSPRYAVLVAQALAPTVRSGNSGLLGEFRIESLTCPTKPTARPTQLTSTGRGFSHQPGHPGQEFHISSAGASRTRSLTTGSPALYQLSYGTGIMQCYWRYCPNQTGCLAGLTAQIIQCNWRYCPNQTGCLGGLTTQIHAMPLKILTKRNCGLRTTLSRNLHKVTVNVITRIIFLTLFG